MANKLNTKEIDQWVEKIINNKNVFGAIVHVENEDRSFVHTSAAGNLKPDSRYFIASVTKLYVSAVMLRLMEEGKIGLEDKLNQHLSDEIIKGVMIFKGVDYSYDLTVRHLLSNTSGIPDYFFHKQPDGKTAADHLVAGNDESWHLEKTLEVVKTLTPKFKPGTKAAYSDTNYQLLGRIIENITGKSIADVFHDFIFSPLKLQKTYTYTDPNDTTPPPIWYGDKELWLPKYMASVGVEGGIVSTAGESSEFLRAFFRGDFFPKENIEALKKWRLIFSPGVFYFGIGLEKLWIPWIVSPFKPIKEVLGFWGQSGAFAFYHAKTGLYMTGTANQLNGRGHQAIGNVIFKVIKAAL
jgi:D-alanyl-D-alanine carboxypeptidase